MVPGYSSEVLRRFEAPRSAGRPSGASWVGDGESAARANHVRLHLKITTGSVESAGFEALGCPHLVAAADRVCEDLIGKPITDLAHYDAGFLDGELPLPPEKLDIRILLEDTVRETHEETR